MLGRLFNCFYFLLCSRASGLPVVRVNGKPDHGKCAFFREGRLERKFKAKYHIKEETSFLNYCKQLLKRRKKQNVNDLLL